MLTYKKKNFEGDCVQKNLAWIWIPHSFT